MASTSPTLIDGGSTSVTTTTITNQREAKLVLHSNNNSTLPPAEQQQLVHDHGHSDPESDPTEATPVVVPAGADAASSALAITANVCNFRNHAADQKRNYQVFPGQNTFFCGGRCITSQEYWAFLVALLLLIGPGVLFLIFTCPFLWQQVHPAIPIMFAYLFVLALVSMIKTSWSDPGIIPRDLDADDASSQGTDASSQLALYREITIMDLKWTLKYCGTCKIYRPPRTSHCRQCDNCVENEDHHCIWLNNCIGRRNYRSFFIFITTSTLLCIYLIVFCIVHVLLAVPEGHGRSFHVMFQHAPVSFSLVIISFLLLLLVGCLTLYHVALVLRGLTTHEQQRARIMQIRGYPTSPYSNPNPLVNVARVLCRPQPKSYLRRRKYVERNS